ncbi:MAG: nucleotidyl transferase AbiEii/AbiGii toxin family protein [Flavobacteriales bacterium]
MENKTINLAVVAEIAEVLKDFEKEMVFVGGAVISLYTDDPAADEIRPTQDVDMTIRIVNLSHWEKVQIRLSKLGFHPDPNGHSICSYKYKDIPVDIMATEDGPLGPTNSWYKTGLENLWPVTAKDQNINVLSAPCFLATKFEAFHNRGKDYRTSHDIEDIVYLLDNRVSIVSDIRKDHPKVREFLKAQLEIIKSKNLLSEVLLAHIHPLMVEERMPIVLDKINQLLSD